MTTPELPPFRLGDQYGRPPANVRHPDALYRVRWTREHWLPRNGGTRWNAKVYSTWRAAERLALRLMDDGAEVEVTAYRLEEELTRRYKPRQKPPPVPPRPRPGGLRLVSTEGDQ